MYVATVALETFLKHLDLPRQAMHCIIFSPSMHRVQIYVRQSLFHGDFSLERRAALTVTRPAACVLTSVSSRCVAFIPVKAYSRLF
jgi:hypothetical protein